MSENFNFTDIADDIASTEADANVAKSGGFDYVPPAEGLARLRFVAYIELGKHFKKGNPSKRIPDKDVEMAELTFELHGSKWPVKELDDGTKIPQRIKVKLTKSLSEKAGYYKLFKRMNYEGKATSFVQLLGKAFIGDVAHYKPPAETGKEQVIIANFRDPEGNLTIRAPHITVFDEETGETSTKTLPVPEAISSQRCFVWNSKAEYLGRMWNSIYIPDPEQAEGDEKKATRNVYQKMIREAINFEGSPICNYLATNGNDLGIPPAEDMKGSKNATAEDNDDPLNGVS